MAEGVATTASPPDLSGVKTFLMNALSARMSGDCQQYNLIVKQLKVREDEESVWQVVLGLSSFVSNFTQRPDIFRDLLDGIFCYDWKGGPRIDAAIANIVEDIVSANATFLPAAFHMFVQNLLPTSGAAAGSESETAVDNKKEVIHRSLRRIIDQAPMGQSILLKMLVDAYPFKRFSCAVQAGYVSQLLRICEYIPGIQPSIIELIISKCVEMDVEIVIEESGDVCLQEGDNSKLGGGQDDDDDAYEEFFKLDEELKSPVARGQQGRVPLVTGNSSSGSGGGGSAVKQQAGGDTAGSQRIAEVVSELADKLDTSLCLLVNFLDSKIRPCQPSTNVAAASNNPPNSATPRQQQLSQDRIYPQLLAIFENSIFPTYKSKFTQFVVFFVASRNESFGLRLADQLLRTLGNDQGSALKRQCAVMYLASYLARAQFLSVATVGDILEKLLNWASNYLAGLPGGGGARASLATGSSNYGKQDQPTCKRQGSGSSGGGGGGGHVFEVEIVSDFDQFGRGLPTSLNNRQQSANAAPKGGEALFPVMTAGKQNTSLLLLKHELFYAVVQAVCYVMCFHGTELAAQQRMNVRLRSQWEGIVSSPLDPLRYTLRTVRVEFLKLAAFVGLFTDECWETFAPDLAYIDELRGSGVAAAVAAATAVDSAAAAAAIATITRDELSSSTSMKSNGGATTTTVDRTTVSSVGGRTLSSGGNRILLNRHHLTQQQQPSNNNNISSAAAAHAAGAAYGRLDKATGTNPLDSFFPFDPCLLAKLHRLIEGSYRPWSGVPGLPVKYDGDEAGDYSSGEEEEEDDYERECLDDESVSFVDDEDDADDADEELLLEQGGGVLLNEDGDYIVQQQSGTRSQRSRSGSSNLLRSGSDMTHDSADIDHNNNNGNDNTLHEHILQELSRNRKIDGSARISRAGNVNGVGGAGAANGSSNNNNNDNRHRGRKVMRSGSIGDSRAIRILNSGSHNDSSHHADDDYDEYISRNNSYGGSSSISSLAHTYGTLTEGGSDRGGGNSVMMGVITATGAAVALPRRLSGELLQLNQSMYTAAAAAARNGGVGSNGYRSGAAAPGVEGLGPYFNTFTGSGSNINLAGLNGTLLSDPNNNRPTSALTAGLTASGLSHTNFATNSNAYGATSAGGTGNMLQQQDSPHSNGKRRPRQYSIGSTGSW